jgi:hypothetical protein
LNGKISESQLPTVPNLAGKSDFAQLPPNIWLVFMDFHGFSKLFPIFNADQRQENSSGEFNKQV